MACVTSADIHWLRDHPRALPHQPENSGRSGEKQKLVTLISPPPQGGGPGQAGPWWSRLGPEVIVLEQKIGPTLGHRSRKVLTYGQQSVVTTLAYFRRKCSEVILECGAY